MRRGEKVTGRKLEVDNNGHLPVAVGWHQHTKEKAAVRNKRKRERWKIMEELVFIFSFSFLPIDLDKYPR